VGIALGLPAAAARAASPVVAPAFPVPAGVPAGPPPIPALPAATATQPPVDQIGDPVRPAAVCGGWHQQGKYGDRWPALSTWWEYSCTDGASQYHSLCAGPACDAYCPDCYWESWQWTDYFYWDGSEPVFYGQAYSDSILYDYQAYDWPPSLPFVSSDWWDAPTRQWYDLGPLLLSVSAAGTGSGEVSSSPAGISCGYSCQGLFDAGTSVTLTADPYPSSVFTGWSGDCTRTGACQVTMNQAHSVTATFAQDTFALTIATQGAGSGQVSSSPAGISCGAACQAGFAAGSTVTLTASPDPGSVFTGWSGDCSGTATCQVSMSQARAVTASFSPNVFGLTVTKLGTGNGVISSSPVGISCGAACQASFAAGSTVTLTASPEPGSLFVGWSGDCSGTGTCQLTMSGARSTSATFASNAPPSASFTLSCTSLVCTFDGGGSSDPDGSITSYGWDFGDGTSAGGAVASHAYAAVGGFTVTLTVTDNGGATAVASKPVALISLSARGYKQDGLRKVDLSWNGPSGASFDVSRNGVTIATVQATAYTDTITNRGSYTYRVCAPAASSCSNDPSVSF
jgi:hypothetical protein